MKITTVKTYTLAAPMPVPWKIGNYVLEKGYATIVEISTDEGIVGIGEAMVRLAPGATKAIIDELLGPSIIGRNPLDIEGIWESMFGLMRYRGHSRGFFMEALSGVDIALWDIAGKAASQPVYTLLYGCGRLEVPAYASSVFWDEPAGMLEKTQALVAAGYDMVKVKVGQGVEKDVECLRAIRAGVGPHIRLVVDANCAYDLGEALRLGRYMEELDIRFFEEPVSPDDLKGYKVLSEKLDIPIAVGEAEFSIYGIKEALENGVSILQPDVVRAGGITGVRKIANLGQAYHARYAPHTGASSAVCLAASLHLAAAVPNFDIYENMVGNNPLVEELLQEQAFRFEKGKIKIPQKPGLGIEFNKEVFKQYCL